MDSDNGIDNSVEVQPIPNGRIIKPTGSIFRLSEKTISQMSDVELKAHIIDVKSKLSARKQEVDSLAIQLSQATHEVSLREDRTRIHLRNVKVPTRKVKVAASATTEDVFKAFTKKLAAEGLSPKEISDILNKLARS